MTVPKLRAEKLKAANFRDLNREPRWAGEDAALVHQIRQMAKMPLPEKAYSWPRRP